MATINLQCNSFSQVCLQAENSMTSREYIGTSLAEIHYGISELLDKQLQVNVQKESLKSTSWVHTSSHKPMKKSAMKMKETKEMTRV